MVGLELAFVITANVSAPLDVGETPLGERRLIPIGAGTVEGPRLSGRVLSGGVDYQRIRDPGLAEIEARYVIEDRSGARIYVENTGIRRGPPDLIARLRKGEPVDPDRIYFRTIPRFETAAPDHAWLMRSLFVGKGTRLPHGVVIEIFEIT